ncbi:sulfotransferase family protein [Kordiimonas pumila]|uniref:Sulfotransferase family protein n=1 Tax=Kordiimonas pumila TaxID=2161677 RepID=A0ABV7D3D5_9PROT|nr:hypothetical protein [Kordiimonas pumila]
MANKHIILGTPSKSEEKTLVIMGAPRGGTSMVAGAFRELGVDLGSRLGENHEDPKFLTKDLDELRERIAVRNAETPAWGWKMPHSLHYIEELLPDIRNPHFVFVFRNMLSTTMSQVNRSKNDTTVENALRFSLRQNVIMAELIEKLDIPMLLINYDRAVESKDEFIQAATDFMNLTVTPEQRQNCRDFIDPETGYKQVSLAYYGVEQVMAENHPDPLKIKRVNRQIAPDKAKGGLVATGDHPAIIFRTTEDNPMPAEFVLKLVNRSQEKSSMKLLFDFDWQFSQNMAYKQKVEPGVSAFKIKTNGGLKRIAVVPEIHDTMSDLILFETLKV